MWRDLLNRLLGRGPDDEPTGPAPESIDDVRTEANATEHLGGFDPEELVEDDEPPR